MECSFTKPGSLSARVGGFSAQKMFMYYKVFAMVTKLDETSH